MVKKINLKKILETNPQVDKKQLEDTERMLENLRRTGLKKRGYQIASPNEQKHVRIDDKALMESRAIHLHNTQ